MELRESLRNILKGLFYPDCSFDSSDFKIFIILSLIQRLKMENNAAAEDM